MIFIRNHRSAAGRLHCITVGVPVGLRVADAWRDFNDRYFSGRLKPVPITLVRTSPHGHWLGLCTGIGSACARARLTAATSSSSPIPGRAEASSPTAAVR